MEKETKTTEIAHEEKTDEQTYQELLKNTNSEDFTSAEEWKKQRLKQLKREGKVWSK